MPSKLGVLLKIPIIPHLSCINFYCFRPLFYYTVFSGRYDLPATFFKINFITTFGAVASYERVNCPHYRIKFHHYLNFFSHSSGVIAETIDVSKSFVFRVII